MAFHGQSVLSCVWGITHAAGAQESPMAPAEVRQESGSRGPARLRWLALVVRKLRGSSGQAGTAGSR